MRNHKKPLITVIIPVFNAQKYLRVALQSTLSQSYRTIEVICVDDSSTDESWKLLQQIAKTDRRMKVLRLEKNQGLSVALNRAIENAQGEFIARMDADDIMLPDRLEKQLTYLLSHPSVVGVGGQCIRIDDNGTYLGIKTFPLAHKEIASMVFRGSPIQHPTLMLRRSMIPKDFTWYNPSLRIGEDYDLYYRLLHFGQLVNLTDYVLLYREYPNNLTLTSPKKTFGYIWQARLNALTKYGYRPDVSSAFNVALQTILIYLLPDRFIYPLHLKTRTFFFKSS